MMTTLAIIGAMTVLAVAAGVGAAVTIIGARMTWERRERRALIAEAEQITRAEVSS